jgi:hypothetical protein
MTDEAKILRRDLPQTSKLQRGYQPVFCSDVEPCFQGQSMIVAGNFGRGYRLTPGSWLLAPGPCPEWFESSHSVERKILSSKTRTELCSAGSYA